MNILGIVEFHPLDGSDRGLFLLTEGPRGEFRVPITQEQAVSLLSQAGAVEEPPEESFEELLHGVGLETGEEPPLVVDGGGFGMGAVEYDDDDGGL